MRNVNVIFLELFAQCLGENMVASPHGHVSLTVIQCYCGCHGLNPDVLP